MNPDSGNQNEPKKTIKVRDRLSCAYIRTHGIGVKIFNIISYNIVGSSREKFINLIMVHWNLMD